MKTVMGIFVRMVIYGGVALLLAQVPLAVTGGKPFKDEGAMAAGFMIGAVAGLGHGIKRAWGRSDPT